MLNILVPSAMKALEKAQECSVIAPKPPAPAPLPSSINSHTVCWNRNKSGCNSPAGLNCSSLQSCHSKFSGTFIAENLIIPPSYIVWIDSTAYTSFSVLQNQPIQHWTTPEPTPKRITFRKQAVDVRQRGRRFHSNNFQQLPGAEFHVTEIQRYLCLTNRLKTRRCRWN